MTPETELAWTAGLFEGEGSIVYGPREGGVRRRLTMASTDEDVMRRFLLIVGVGVLNGPYARKKINGEPAKPMWMWAANRWVDIDPLLRSWLPYLGDRRREKAEQLLADPAPPPGRPRSVK